MNKSYIFRSSKPKLPGTILTEKDLIIIHNFEDLSLTAKKTLLSIVSQWTNSFQFVLNKFGDVDLNIQLTNYSMLAELIGRELFDFGININNKKSLLVSKRVKSINSQLENVSFAELECRIKEFINHLTNHKQSLFNVLRTYETLNTAQDEFDRSVDHLANLHVNKDYFQKRIGGVVTFLPLNQPLYSFVCFAIVPSLLSKYVWVRPPTRMHTFFPYLVDELKIEKYFPNINVNYLSRSEFVNKYKYYANAVIFTGQPQNGFKLRKQFSRESLFILNGAGHNPIIVTDSADLHKAVDSVLRVTLQNQGQDCAAPNSILVHQSIYPEFERILLKNLQYIKSKIGGYDDDNTIVGPNTDPDHTIKIAKLFKKLRKYFIYGGEINPINGLIHPTVFHKPLKYGPCYDEFFAPIIMLQSYQNDAELTSYFETREYFRNAMYVSVFGYSEYVKSLVKKGIHSLENLLHNTDLHEVERGFLPYGGYGPDASCIMINDQKIPGATLPQRDIFCFLVKDQIGE